MELKKIKVIIKEDVEKEQPLWFVNIKALVTIYKMSVKLFSEQVGIPSRTAYTITGGTSISGDMQISTAKKICNYFQISIDDFSKKLITEDHQRFVPQFLNQNFKTKIKENLTLLMNEANLNKALMSKLSGINWQTIANILKRPSADSSLSTLIQIADFFGISIDELIGEISFSQNRQKGFYAPKIQKKELKQKLDFGYLAVIGMEDVVEWLNLDSESAVDVKKVLIVPQKDVKKLSKSFAVEIKNKGFGVNKGDIVIINTNLKEKNSSNLFLIYSPEYSIFIFAHKDGRDLYVTYLDPQIKFTELTECQIIGSVAKIIKQKQFAGSISINHAA